MNAIRIVVFSVVASLVAEADNAEAKLDYARAKAFYDDGRQVEQAIRTLSLGLSAATEPDLQYDMLLLWTRSLYYLGLHTADAKKKIETHLEGYKKAEQARAVNPDYADALYFSAANLLRWGKANGVLASLSKKDEVIATLNAMFYRLTRNQSPGDSYEFFGADRALGKLYFELPSFAGGSIPLALKHLGRAFALGKNHSMNVVYYAEALWAVGEKKKAVQILDEMLSQDPTTFNPERVPETFEEFELARELRKEFGTI